MVQWHLDIFPAGGEFRTIACSMMDVSSVRIDFDAKLETPCSVLCDSIVRAEVDVSSRFPAPIQCGEICITVKSVKMDTKATSRPGAKKSVDKADVPSEAADDIKTLNYTGLLPIKEQQHLKQDGSISSVALVCPTAHQFLG